MAEDPHGLGVPQVARSIAKFASYRGFVPSNLGTRECVVPQDAATSQVNPALASIPFVYDIVVSDFGREAAIAYLQESSAMEMEAILRATRTTLERFSDADRRIMPYGIGDIEYIKAPLIASFGPGKLLDERVLVGLDSDELPTSVSNRLVDLIVAALRNLAVTRSADHVRIVLPCNTLGGFGESFEALMGNIDTRIQLVQTGARRSQTAEQLQWISDCRVSLCTVPTAVVDFISRSASRKPVTELIVLGGRATQQSYKRAAQAGAAGLLVADLSDYEQELVNNAISVAIDQDSHRNAQARQSLERVITRPRLASNPNSIVIEACTDFDLGIGLRSRSILAYELVRSVYGELVDLGGPAYRRLHGLDTSHFGI